MFKDDQKAIEEYAWQEPATILDVLVFTRLTIRQRLNAVPLFMKRYRVAGNLEWHKGIPNNAYAEMQEVAWDLWLGRDFYHTHARAVLERAREIPGIGIIKAGFITQMLCGKVGCLDMHNVQRFGIDPRRFDNKGTPKAIHARISDYIHECARQGGAEYLWDSWCTYVAATQPNTYRSAEHVSKIHPETIIAR